MFNEKENEYSSKQGKEIPVWKSPKYEEAKRKAIELIESKMYDLVEGDFWILMNETKSGKMMYTGLIISHNGCLKINDKIEEKLRFKPSCMSLDKEGYANSLVYTYINDEQGVYEVGEVSASNCKNAYPYAMALKRCMDRVILKNCKLAYSGVYSDSEADEFVEKPVEKIEEKKITHEQVIALQAVIEDFVDEKGGDLEKIKGDMLKEYKVKSFEEMTEPMYTAILQRIQKAMK